MTTRFIASSSPLIYWFLAALTDPVPLREPSHHQHSLQLSFTQSAPSLQSARSQDSTEVDSSILSASNGDDASVFYAESEITKSGSKPYQIAKSFVSLDEFPLFDLQHTSSLLVYFYFGAYIVLGCLMFPNNLPWT